MGVVEALLGAGANTDLQHKVRRLECTRARLSRPFSLTPSLARPASLRSLSLDNTSRVAARARGLGAHGNMLTRGSVGGAGQRPCAPACR